MAIVSQAHVAPSSWMPPPGELYRVSVDQYERMIASGALGEDDPIELLNGVLVTKMLKGPRHATAVRRCNRAIEGVLPPGWHVRKEDPVRIAGYDEPEPDVAVVRGDDDAYEDRHPGPGDIALIVEVAETSLERDRSEKCAIYARAGIPAYWILDLVGRRLETYAVPASGAYPAPTILGEDDSVELVIEGQSLGRIAVAELLPGA